VARTRRGVARAPGPGTGGRRRRFGFFLLIAGGVYLLMSAEGVAAPPTVTTTVSALAYTENAAATAVDSGLVLNEPEADPILGATVRILTNYQNGEDVLAFSDQLGIAGAWNAGTGILTLSGTTTAADYQTALRSVTYQNTSDAPSTSTRTVQIVVTDANAESGSATRDIAVTAVDDPLDVTTTGGSLAFTEGAAATVLDSALTVVDLDHNITGATVQVTGNYVNGEDVLAFTDQLGITGVWAPVSGTLTLSGTTTPANYQTALRTITYANASENPSTLPRSVTFTPTSPGNSDSGIRVVAITAVNDAPAAGGATTVTNPGGGAANVLEDSVPGAANIRLTPPTLTDVDGSAPTQVRIMTVTGGTIAQGDGSVIGLDDDERRECGVRRERFRRRGRRRCDHRRHRQRQPRERDAANHRQLRERRRCARVHESARHHRFVGGGSGHDDADRIGDARRLPNRDPRRDVRERK